MRELETKLIGSRGSRSSGLEMSPNFRIRVICSGTRSSYFHPIRKQMTRIQTSGPSRRGSTLIDKLSFPQLREKPEK